MPIAELQAAPSQFSSPQLEGEIRVCPRTAEESAGRVLAPEGEAQSDPLEDKDLFFDY